MRENCPSGSRTASACDSSARQRRNRSTAAADYEEGKAIRIAIAQAKHWAERVAS